MVPAAAERPRPHYALECGKRFRRRCEDHCQKGAPCAQALLHRAGSEPAGNFPGAAVKELSDLPISNRHTHNKGTGSFHLVDMYPLYWTSSKEGIFI